MKNLIIDYQKEIQRNKLYATYQCTYQGIPRYIRIFDTSVPDYQLIRQSLEMTLHVSQVHNQMAFPQLFLLQTVVYQGNDRIAILQQPYQQTLESYLRKHPINQNQAEQIFTQILKIAYSLYLQRIFHANLRPQHFVKVGSMWKISTFIFEKPTDQQQAIYQYQWNSNYQPPQCYFQNQFADYQYVQMIVWYLASIYIDLLTSSHKLSSIQVINQFKNTQFSLSKLKIHKNISPEMNSLIIRMLHYNAQDRIKCGDLFKQKLKIADQGLNQIAEQDQKQSENQDSLGSINSNTQISQKGQEEAQKGQDDVVEELGMFCGLFKGVQISKHWKIASESLFLKSKLQVKIRDQISEYKLSSKECSQDGIHRIYYQKFDHSTFMLNLKNRIKSMLTGKMVNVSESSLMDCFDLAVNFAIANDLSCLYRDLDQEKNILNIKTEQFSKWIKSNTYKGLKKQVSLSLRQALEILDQSKRRVRKLSEDINCKVKASDLAILRQNNCIQTQFKQIKNSYRNIVLLMFHKSKELLQELSQDQRPRICMMLMVLLSFDKTLNQRNNRKLFEPFLKSQFIKDSKLINYQELQNYILKENGDKIVQNANLIYSLCFQQ